MRTLAVINQKGGCGKTTVAIHTAGALARLGKRVLLIDMDPQAHASLGLGVAGEEEHRTAYELLLDPDLAVTDAMREIQPGLWLVPSSTALSGVEQELAAVIGREERLAEKISVVPSGRFDFVVVDCPPSVGLLTFNALVAADEVLIPVDASFFSMHGLGKLRETISVIEEELNHRVRVHVVCNNVDTRTSFSNRMLGEVHMQHGGALLQTFVSNSVRLKEAAMRGKTIFDVDATSRPALQFSSLADELIQRAPRVATEDTRQWMRPPDGPQRVSEGVLFTLDVPGASEVYVAGEFPDWPREGRRLARDPADGLWKAILDLPPGEYDYHFVVDGVSIRDPANRDYTRDEFGQESSHLAV
jgi:chromosome partitioning protein